MQHLNILTLLFLPLSNGSSANDDLSPRPRLVRNPVVALLPVDKLDLHALVRRTDLLRREFGHLHEGGAGGRLGQTVALENRASHANADKVVGLFGEGGASCKVEKGI